MKNLYFLILLCVIFLLSGCSGSVDNNNPPNVDTKTPIIEKPESKIQEETSVSKTEEPAIPDTFIEDTRKQYSELYDTTHTFTDMYIAEKAWLIGDENIVQLTSIAGFNDVAVLSRSNIERIEQTSFADFSTISIIDKTGQTLSLIISPEELLEIIELLK